ncbi:MAG: DUF2970 domain-containing protein [Pseudomonadota bacterium]
MTTPDPDPGATSGPRCGTGWRAVLGSVLAAGFGVQSDAARARDFNQGNWMHFVLGGAVGTVAFVLVIYGAVLWVLPD